MIHFFTKTVGISLHTITGKAITTAAQHILFHLVPHAFIKCQ